MKSMRTVQIILLMMIMSMNIGCAPKTVEDKKNEPVRIGLSLDSIVVERWQRELEILVATANDLGAEVDVQIANEDIEKQREQIKYLIDQKVDVLIIVPKDARAFSEVIGEASRNGIKIIAYDRLIMQPDVDLYISFDNVEIGKGISKRLIDALPQEVEQSSNLLIINGDPKDNNSILLNEGFYETLQPEIDNRKVEIIEEIWSNEWREQYGKDLVEKCLSEGIRIDGIIAANDVLATGAIEVLAKWRMAGEVFVVSQDAELSACQRIVEKTQLATAYKPINDLASSAAKMAIAMAKGEKIITNDFIYNEYRQIPYLKLDAYIVDITNMDQVIINSGFHRKEDIYRNSTIGQ